MKLIDKDAVVAGIKRLSQKARELYGYSQFNTAYDNVLSFLNTLEVKEVDLENSVKGRIDYPLIGADFPNIYPNYKELKDYCDKNGIKDEDKVKIIIIKDVTL